MSDVPLFSIKSLIPSPQIESTTYSVAVTFKSSCSNKTCSSIVIAALEELSVSELSVVSTSEVSTVISEELLSSATISFLSELDSDPLPSAIMPKTSITATRPNTLNLFIFESPPG